MTTRERLQLYERYMPIEQVDAMSEIAPGLRDLLLSHDKTDAALAHQIAQGSIDERCRVLVLCTLPIVMLTHHQFNVYYKSTPQCMREIEAEEKRRLDEVLAWRRIGVLTSGDNSPFFRLHYMMNKHHYVKIVGRRNDLIVNYNSFFQINYDIKKRRDMHSKTYYYILNSSIKEDVELITPKATYDTMRQFERGIIDAGADFMHYAYQRLRQYGEVE